jgi:hypothetical protein
MTIVVSGVALAFDDWLLFSRFSLSHCYFIDLGFFLFSCVFFLEFCFFFYLCLFLPSLISFFSSIASFPRARRLIVIRHWRHSHDPLFFFFFFFFLFLHQRIIISSFVDYICGSRV